MTKEDLENYLVLTDVFRNKCKSIAAILSEVVEDFRYAGDWTIVSPFYTCTGEYHPGYVYSGTRYCDYLYFPFEYLYTSEEELKEIVKNHPEKIENLIFGVLMGNGAEEDSEDKN